MIIAARNRIYLLILYTFFILLKERNSGILCGCTRLPNNNNIMIKIAEEKIR
jgi:hypothetical protein